MAVLLLENTRGQAELLNGKLIMFDLVVHFSC